MTGNKSFSVAEKLGNKIVQLRTEKGMSRDKLAEKSGISKSGLGYIENGRKNPRTESLVLIANALDVPIVELFNF